MTKQTEALKLALEALEYHIEQTRPIHRTSEAITAIREALAEQPKVWVTPKLRPLAKLAKELDGVVADVEQGDGFDDVCLDTVKYVRDELAEQPAQQQEPVAWMHKETGLLRQANKAKGGDFEPNHWTPLYTAIEQALAAPYVASQLVQEPVATLIDHYGFTDGVVRFDGVENMEQLPIGTKFYIAPLNVATPLADQCVCGEPYTPGTHRTDGPCLAEQPAQQQEPVAWRDHVEQRLLTWRQSFVNKSGDQLALDDFMDKRSLDDLIDFVCSEYTSPPASKPWVGLTDEEKSDIWCVVTNRDFVTEDTHVYADAIEAKLKEKNT